MTDSPTTTETPDTGAEGQQDDPTTDTTGATPGPDSPADLEPDTSNQEAAKYRRRLRDTETERDGLTAQLAAQRDALLAGYIDARLVTAAGADPAEAVDPDTGLFDPARAQQLANRVHAEVGVTPGVKQRPAVGQLKSGAAGRPAPKSEGWAGLLNSDAAE